MRGSASRPSRLRQRGAASIEFALLFPVLFLILYAIITYGLIFSAQHSLALAAAEGGRAALRHQRADTAEQALALRMAAAQDAAERPLAWLQKLGSGASPVQSSVMSEVCPDGRALTCLTVRVDYVYERAPLIPSLPLLPVPRLLSSESVVLLSATQLL